jgi:hypothetical protein
MRSHQYLAVVISEVQLDPCRFAGCSNGAYTSQTSLSLSGAGRYTISSVGTHNEHCCRSVKPGDMMKARKVHLLIFNDWYALSPRVVTAPYFNSFKR